MRRVVIVGAGPAAMSAVAELRRQDYQGSILVIGAEPHMPYRRPPLSKHPLPTSHAQLALDQAGRAEATWLLGRSAHHLDRQNRVLLLDGGDEIPYDGLIIATGVRARRLPGRLHQGRPEVMTLRGFGDLARLHGRLQRVTRVVILGAGFLGSELAATIRRLGCSVDLVERDRLPLLGPLGPVLAQRIADEHRRHDVRLHLGRTVDRLHGTDRLDAVRLDDGTTLPADLLITALGSIPETGWLAGSGLVLDDGVRVDNTGRAAPGIVAAGDVARWPHPWPAGESVRAEHHDEAVAQGAHVARTLLGDPAPYAHTLAFSTHIHDMRLHSVGFTGKNYRLHVVKEGPGGRMLAEYRHAGRLVGAITHGYIRDLTTTYRDLPARSCHEPSATSPVHAGQRAAQGAGGRGCVEHA
ncbi:NAD(P)/FAD-dependent oxidoreductase [Phytoactinopolyspora halotolerans]|nr:FAD/NAD(P)-binding oxidoreductase [Phytoactinopolyspora halotolerans]